ncbi:6-phosphogluconolactonase, cycloisomerase 2 family [Bosea sp. OK403]|uniref:lactonase family protein n=1 Tax=Bosea sp. OK403 TaxID=1855286 RepID=UPI0008F1FA45|nr:beta-propeller fold lactonase family protein [Bosea sp. OK403]SFJ13532.1 6-phosphogluconolactonase, cycloisomerase 2 family [Bosea sp. OK403]
MKTTRRDFNMLATASLAATAFGSGAFAQTGGTTMLYVAVGPELTQYTVGGATIAPVEGSTVSVPAAIQYVWQHPKKPIAYVASSNRFTSTTDDLHHITAFAIAPGGGKLTMIGQPKLLGSRPINISVDQTGGFLLVAYNGPSNITVHPIGADGTIGDAIKQAGKLDTGIYAHQVRVLPSNRAALLVTRGNDAVGGKPEDPGALKLFSFDKGRLADKQSVAPGDGYGFGPRHVDFHPSKPWIYVAMERENQLQTFVIGAGDRLSTVPAFVKTTLAEPGKVRPGQAAGAIHVSRDGRFLYLSNRADGKTDLNGKKVFVGGENSIAVFAIDQTSGEPKLIQALDTQSYHVRTFAIDSTGKTLVAASVAPMDTASGNDISTTAATLTAFTIGPDGKLTFAGKRSVDTAKGAMFWCGFQPLS